MNTNGTPCPLCSGPMINLSSPDDYSCGACGTEALLHDILDGILWNNDDDTYSPNTIRAVERAIKTRKITPTVQQMLDDHMEGF